MASNTKTTAIIQEIVDKQGDYEDHFSPLEEYNEIAQIYKATNPRNRTSISNSGLQHRFSNPRMTEMHRAVETVSTFVYRMMTANEPFFEVLAAESDLFQEELDVVEATLQRQLVISQYRRHLLTSLRSLVLFGNVFVEENYKTEGFNTVGRTMPFTSFEPRSMLQVAFQRGAVDLDRTSWISVSDIVNNADLRRRQNQEGIGLQSVWNFAELQKAIDDSSKGSASNVNHRIRERLQREGFSTDDELSENKELITYRGKLDTLNDGIEYVVGIVNRRFLVRFHANDWQHGRRNIRIARWETFELEPLAQGMGTTLKHLHNSMDANRQKAQDGISFASYNMFLKSRAAGINDEDLKIRPLQVIETDEMGGLKPLPADLAGPTAAFQLEELLKQDFRNTAGAPDSLQAIASVATTATEASLSQSEAVRNLAVKAEHVSDSLMREHLEVMHMNNVQMLDQPLNVNVKGRPELVYPSDLKLNVDFVVKTSTDKDFRPERLKKMLEAFQIIVSTKSQHPELAGVPLIPLLTQIMRALGVDMKLFDQNAQGAPSLDDIVPGQLPQGGGIPQISPQDIGDVGGEATTQTPIGDIPGSP